jgi:predicted nucleic acid-binding protein
VYLVDTNVISASAPTKIKQLPDLAGWMDRNSAALYLSVITIAEVEDGIAKAQRKNAHRKADRLAAWLEALLHLYLDRVLPLDVAAARILGRLSDRARGHGQSPGFADLAIAATAAHYDFTILTRNVRHFAGQGLRVHDPFVALPA